MICKHFHFLRPARRCTGVCAYCSTCECLLLHMWMCVWCWKYCSQGKKTMPGILSSTVFETMPEHWRAGVVLDFPRSHYLHASRSINYTSQRRRLCVTLRAKYMKASAMDYTNITGPRKNSKHEDFIHRQPKTRTIQKNELAWLAFRQLHAICIHYVSQNFLPMLLAP